MLYLVLAFSILFAGLVWYRPLLAVQVTLFALPAYLIRFNVGIPLTLLEVMILLNFSIWFIRNMHGVTQGIKNRLTHKAVTVDYPFGVEMVLLVITGFIAAGVAHFSNEAMGIWKAYFFEPVLFALVIYQVVGRQEMGIEDKVKRIIWPLIISGLVVSILAVYQKITGNLIDNTLWQAPETRRIVSVFGYPNAVGLYLETITIYIFGLILLLRGERVVINKFILLVLMHFTILAILFAKSAGAMLGLTAGFAMFLLFYSKMSRRTVVLGFILAILVVIITPQGREKLQERLLLKDFSGQVRLIGWSETYKMLVDGRLVSGAGLAGFREVVAPYHVPGFYFNKDKDPDFHRKLILFNQEYRNKYWQPLEIYMYPHNIILNFWSELGVLGLLVITFLLGRFYYYAIKLLNNECRILVLTAMSAMTTILVHGLVDVPFFKNDLAILFWLPVVIVGLIQLTEKPLNLKNTTESSRVLK